MTDAEEKENASFSPSGSRSSEDVDESSLASMNDTAAIRVSIDLHRHNTQLLREKQEMESKHNDDIMFLRRQISELESRIAQLIALGKVNVVKNQTLSDHVQSLMAKVTDLETKLATDAEKFQTNLHNYAALVEESTIMKGNLRLSREENKRKDTQLSDLKQQLIEARSNLELKHEELLDLRRSITSDTKLDEIFDLKNELAKRDQQIFDLQNDRDADNARMESVKDVQVAYETLRKNCHEKDSQIQNLEDVLDQTIREKEHLSSSIMKLQEENRARSDDFEKLKESFEDYKRNAELQYEDTCQQYVAKLNSMHMIKYGDADYPGKTDNVFPTDEKSSLDSSVHHDYIEFGSGAKNESIGRHEFDVLSAEATRTIEALRSEYQIEVSRNANLQQENDRLVLERERLKNELYGEMQNGSLSSLNCVLLARRNGFVNESIDDEIKEFTYRFRCLKTELQKCIAERDEAKTIATRVNSDLDQLSAQNHDFHCRLEHYEREIADLRIELKEKRKLQFNYTKSTNRCKALVYQKQYLKLELRRMENSYHQLCANFNFNFNGLKKRNGDVSASCVQLRFSAKTRFRSAVWTVIAVWRMKRQSDKKRKYERVWSSDF